MEFKFSKNVSTNLSDYFFYRVAHLFNLILFYYTEHIGVGTYSKERLKKIVFKIVTKAFICSENSWKIVFLYSYSIKNIVEL